MGHEPPQAVQKWQEGDAPPISKNPTVLQAQPTGFQAFSPKASPAGSGGFGSISQLTLKV